jgi:hypothetical protein
MLENFGKDGNFDIKSAKYDLKILLHYSGMLGFFIYLATLSHLRCTELGRIRRK